jgi:methylmalonyl-CoA/ethylmalonyl-CoA epimerase
MGESEVGGVGASGIGAGGVGKVDHIAMAVQDTAAALALYAGVLALPTTATEVHQGEGVKITFLQAGETRIELLESVAEGSAVARFLEKRGEGLHHICVEVDDLAAA